MQGGRLLAIEYFPHFLIAFIAGIGLASLLPAGYLENDLLFFAAAIGFSIAAVFASWFFKASGVQRLLLLSCCIFACFALGLWRYSMSERAVQGLTVQRLHGRQVELGALVVREPQVRSGQAQVVLGRLEYRQVPLSGQAIVKLRGAEFGIGERLAVSCRMESPQPIKDFRYDRFLAKDGIVSVCQQPQLLRRDGYAAWQAEPWLALRRSVASFKSRLRADYLAALPYAEGSLLAGIMLGDGYLLADDQREAFSRAGLSHIIAISGLNMTLIAVLMMWLFVCLGLWRQQAFRATLAVLWLYTLMAGAPSSAVRASLMSSLALWAYDIGRLGDIRRLLYAAAAAMLAFNPRLLRDDIGFQLSVMALFSLVQFYEPIKTWLAGRSPAWVPALVTESVSVTLAAQVLVWPLLALNFHQLSLVAPLANLMAIWLVAPLMIAAAVASVLSLSIYSPAWFAPVHWLLYWLNLVAGWFGRQSWAALDDFAWPLWLTLAYYCFIVILIYRPRNDQDSACKTQ